MTYIIKYVIVYFTLHNHTYPMEFIEYCANLRPTDWSHPVNKKWLVKDVVIHMLSWEKEVTLELRKAVKTMRKPWFVGCEPADYDMFNARLGDTYQNIPPSRLLTEWRKWQEKLDCELATVRKNRQKKKLEKLGWVFKKRPDDHYLHHLKQIESAVRPTFPYFSHLRAFFRI